MATKKTNDEVIIKMEKIEGKTVKLRIVGDTPLIMHCWSEKSKAADAVIKRQYEKTGKRGIASAE